MFICTKRNFHFSDPRDIPIDDKNIYRLFSETEIIGVKESDIGSKVASYAVPEFGTNFVRQMLVETLPKTFAQLVKISDFLMVLTFGIRMLRI